jgi:hypothetical protein
MKHTIHNEKGIALLTTLMLMVLGFGVVATLLYMVTYGTKTTSIEQKYATALDAAKGGVDFMVNMMQNELFGPPGLGGVVVSSSSSLCMEQKLTQPTTDSDPSQNWRKSSCCPDNSTQAITYCSTLNEYNTNIVNSDPKILPDLTLTLAGCQVFVKIINTKITNNDFLYTVSVRADSPTPSREPHAEISFLYSLAKPPP